MDIAHKIIRNSTIDEGECWIWSGCKDRDGYGITCKTEHHASTRAARTSYEAFIGPIPEGYVIDHLCRNPPCVNPSHLEAVTVQENTLRGAGPTAANARKECCPQCGGPYRIQKWNGYRSCKPCTNEYARKYRQRNQQMEAP